MSPLLSPSKWECYSKKSIDPAISTQNLTYAYDEVLGVKLERVPLVHQEVSSELRALTTQPNTGNTLIIHNILVRSLDEIFFRRCSIFLLPQPLSWFSRHRIDYLFLTHTQAFSHFSIPSRGNLTQYCIILYWKALWNLTVYGVACVLLFKFVLVRYESN